MRRFLRIVCVATLMVWGSGSNHVLAQKTEREKNAVAPSVSWMANSKKMEANFYGWVHMGPTFSAPDNPQLALQDISPDFQVYRARLGSKGFLLDPSFTYHIQLALGAAELAPHPTNPNQVNKPLLDAYFKWEAFEGFYLSMGQRFLPTHREGFTGAKLLQFNDRSMLFRLSGADRDQGVFLEYEKEIVNEVIIRLHASATKGEGRDVGLANRGGLCYNVRGELLPFGAFSKGNESGQPDLIGEEQLKLSIGGGYELNDNAVREFSHKGSFVPVQRDVEGYFTDVLFKFNGFSFLGEYYESFTALPIVYDVNFAPLAKFNSGVGVNLQTSYTFPSLWEIKARHTRYQHREVLQRDELREFTLGFSKYFLGHTFKIQTEATYWQNVTQEENRVILAGLVAIGF